MANPATLTISSSLIVTAQGSKTIGPLNINVANPIDNVILVAFPGAGAVQVLVPAAATAAVVVPPVGNVVSLTLKGAPGDATGVALNPGLPAVLPVAAGIVSFYLVSGAAIAAGVEVTFI